MTNNATTITIYLTQDDKDFIDIIKESDEAIEQVFLRLLREKHRDYLKKSVRRVLTEETLLNLKPTPREKINLFPSPAPRMPKLVLGSARRMLRLEPSPRAYKSLVSSSISRTLRIVKLKGGKGGGGSGGEGGAKL